MRMAARAPGLPRNVARASGVSIGTVSRVFNKKPDVAELESRNYPLMIVGVMAGTYSSIYIANVVLIWLKLSAEDLIPPAASEKEVDDRP